MVTRSLCVRYSTLVQHTMTAMDIKTKQSTDETRWARLSEAVAFALRIHAEQARKGSKTPHISHLLDVAGLVLKHGGDEEQAMATLLHDAVEDKGTHQLDAIRQRFGARVAAIVEDCTNADTLPKPSWQARKETYIAHLKHAAPEVWLISRADKLHNARAICTALRTYGCAVSDRFKGGRDRTVWYYETMSNAFKRLTPGPLAVELAEAVGEMKKLG